MNFARGKRRKNSAYLGLSNARQKAKMREWRKRNKRQGSSYIYRGDIYERGEGGKG